MKTQPFKALALDLGNVVLYFQHAIACCRLSRLGGGRISAADLQQRIFDSGLNSAADRGMPLDEIVRQLRQAAEIAAPRDQVLRAFADIFWTNSDVCDCLPFIPRNLRLLLASNTNESHAQFFQNEFAHYLRAFDGLVLSCEVQAAKPSPAYYDRLIATAGCAPHEILFFDDRADNLQGAANCGLIAVPYLPGTSFRDELARQGILLTAEPVR